MVNHSKPVVAIFGGSFDPPHKGHQKVVENALASLEIDRLIIVPSYLNPFKTSSLATPQQRLQWCHTLFDPMKKVCVDDYEIRQGRSTTTQQSVRHFKQHHCVKYLIIGSDNLSTLTQWDDFNWLNAEVTWVIANRSGHTIETKALKKWLLLEMDEMISSSQIRNTLDLQYIDNKIKPSVKDILEGKQPMTIEQRIENIVQILDEKKAEEIEVFNLDDADYIADRVVIANSLNLKHTQALFEHLKSELRPKGEEFMHADMSDEWIVADLGDILVHIMIPEYRQRYSLETFLSELVENQKRQDEDPA